MRRPNALLASIGALLGVFAGVLSLGLVGAADAAVTIGSPLVGSPENAHCGEDTFLNYELAPPAIVKAPYAGSVVRWRIDLWEPGGSFKYRLRILKPPKNPSGKYKFIASGPEQMAPADGLNVLDLPQPIPIEAGDLIAFDCEEHAPAALQTPAAPLETKFAYFGSIPADGESVAAMNTGALDELLINADVVGVPALTGVSPASVPARGGSTVTLTGEHLAELSGASIGGGALDGVTPISETEAKLTVPAHAAGKVDLAVANVAGASPVLAGALEYVGPPTISGYSQKRLKWRPKAGTRFSFTLNEAASAKLVFQAHPPGRKYKCGRKNGKPLWVCRFSATLPLEARAGADSIPFKGRLSPSRELKPGRYWATLSATNSFGESATSKPLSFKIVR